jgi:TPR repeat protein
MLNNYPIGKSFKGKTIKENKGTSIGNAKAKTSNTKSQTTKITHTRNYDKDKPFQGYLKLTYSLSQSYDAKKYSEAFPKLKIAAEKGHKKAQYRLGRCYDKGNGVKEDDDKAFEWYFKSAERGFAKAQYQVGKSYKNGEGVEEDRVKAFQYFTKAAKQGNGEAQLALGKCYLKGKGTTEDKEKAKSWFMKAVKNEKDGEEVVKQLREDLADHDDDARIILQMVGLK